MRLDSLLMLGLQPNLPAATPTPPRWGAGEGVRCRQYGGFRLPWCAVRHPTDFRLPLSFQAAYLSMFLITPITLREMVRVICLLIWSPTESAKS